MVDALVTAVAVLLWVVTLAKLPTVRHRSASTTWLWTTFLALALGATFFCPWAPAALHSLVAGTGHVAEPTARTFVLVAAFGAQSLLREITRRGERLTWGNYAARAAPLAAVLLVLWIAFFAAAVAAAQLGARANVGPWPAVYILSFVLYLGYVVTDVLIGCRRYARSASGALARGLRFIAIGCALGLGYITVKIASLLMLYLGAPIPFTVEATLGRSFAVAAGALVAAGSAWPAIARLADDVRRSLTAYRLHRRLYPLWRGVVAAAPAVALEPGRGRLAELVRVRHLGFRLYRRVIEIRDARLALRPYLDADVAEIASIDAESRGLAGQDREAFVEGVVLRQAVAAAAGDATPKRAWRGRGVEGDSVASETEWLAAVAGYYEQARTDQAEDQRSLASPAQREVAT